MVNSREPDGDDDGAEAVVVVSSLKATMHGVLPKLIVFDLDYTLWPFYCEFRSKREMPFLYPYTKGMLCALRDKKIPLAIASRSPTPYIADAFLDKLGLKTYFVSQQIYPSLKNKTDHFNVIQSETGVPFCSMLFFDDENRNIEEVSKMGVTSILVEKGMTLETMKDGLAKFAKNDAEAKNKAKKTLNLSSAEENPKSYYFN